MSQYAADRIAVILDTIQELHAEARGLSDEYDIPANIKVGGRTNDFRMIDAVDWDSSSMYC